MKPYVIHHLCASKQRRCRPVHWGSACTTLPPALEGGGAHAGGGSATWGKFDDHPIADAIGVGTDHVSVELVDLGPSCAIAEFS